MSSLMDRMSRLARAARDPAAPHFVRAAAAADVSIVLAVAEEISELAVAIRSFAAAGVRAPFDVAATVATRDRVLGLLNGVTRAFQAFRTENHDAHERRADVARDAARALASEARARAFRVLAEADDDDINPARAAKHARALADDINIYADGIDVDADAAYSVARYHAAVIARARSVTTGGVS